jgi:c-di-GMP-binding flagellar brake protein YcgR
MRRLQRRLQPRHEVSLAGLMVFISAEKSINAAVEIANMSIGGAEVLAPAAPPLGMHTVLLMRHEETEISTIARVVHADPIDGGFRIGVAFVEMSRRDMEQLHRFISALE